MKCSFFADVLQVYNKEDHMKVEVKNGRLTISLKLRKPTPSKSGKTLLVASTRGVQTSSVEVNGKPVRIVRLGEKAGWSNSKLEKLRTAGRAA